MPRSVKKVKKFCSVCSREVLDDDIYCDICGNRLDEFNEIKKDEPTVMIQKTKSVKNQKKNNGLLYVLGAVLFVILGAGGMWLYIDFTSDNENSVANKIFKEVSVVDNGIADAVSKVYDSVVVVENYSKENLISTGTGFVYKKDKKYGYILTNNHVIDSSDEIYVTFTNGTREKVEVVGTDAYSDVALLKVKVDAIISVAEIGSSKDLRLGDTTFAIGAPLDYQVYSWSVTRGIISGKDRLVEVSVSNSNTNDYVMEVLQTDTAINSGNSGGPLCNGNGEVIGITNMKLASSSVEGMGFAIPIEKALEYAKMFIEGKTIVRPYLGISMYDLRDLQNSIYRYTIDTELTEGIYIASVDKNSSAAKAGLQKGDVITEIDGVEVKSSAYLRYMLYQHQVGEKMKVTYYRKDKKQTTTITLTANSNNNL